MPLHFCHSDHCSVYFISFSVRSSPKLQTFNEFVLENAPVPHIVSFLVFLNAFFVVFTIPLQISCLWFIIAISFEDRRKSVLCLSHATTSYQAMFFILGRVLMEFQDDQYHLYLNCSKCIVFKSGLPTTDFIYSSCALACFNFSRIRLFVAWSVSFSSRMSTRQPH